MQVEGLGPDPDGQAVTLWNAEQGRCSKNPHLGITWGFI